VVCSPACRPIHPERQDRPHHRAESAETATKPWLYASRVAPARASSRESPFDLLRELRLRWRRRQRQVSRLGIEPYASQTSGRTGIPCEPLALLPLVVVGGLRP
jgi:hypothetical protein